MANGVYKITEDFEKALSDYTGAPYVVTVDNMSNALFLALYYEKVHGLKITIPNRTYPSVPCEIIHAIDDKTVDEFVKFWEKKIYGDN